MTHRERMLATIHGRAFDQIPWAPRMDLWCIALRERGTIPPQFAGLSLEGIADVLAVGCHANRGDYTLTRDPADFALRAFGLENHQDFPFRVKLNLPMKFSFDGENYLTTIQTTAGELTTHLYHTGEMRRSGISIPFAKRPPVRSVADLEAVGQVFENLEVVQTADNYARFRDRIGERGLAIASGPVGASPTHLLLHDLMPMEQFYYLYTDERESLYRLAEKMTPYFQSALAALLQCNAEVIFWGANYDQDLTPPAFFKREIMPWLQRVSEQAHSAGKLVLTHTDGENRFLLPLYPSCGFDVAESVCPTPMTSCTLGEVRAGMGPKVTVWGGIPSVALLDTSMDDLAFESYLDKVFGEVGAAEHLILGVADNVPPDADLDRLDRIKKRIECFEPTIVKAP